MSDSRVKLAAMDTEPATVVTAADPRTEHRLRLAEAALLTVAEQQGDGKTGPLPAILADRTGLAALGDIIDAIAAAHTRSGYEMRLVQLRVADLHTAAEAVALMLDPAAPPELANAVAACANIDHTTPDQLAVDAWHALTKLGHPVVTQPTEVA